MARFVARDGGEIQASSSTARISARHSIGTCMSRPRARPPCTTADSPVTSNAQLFRLLSLLWLAGLATRITILAVPPLIPLVRDELRMTEAQIGFLVALPVLMFAVAAIPGSLLIARLGTG